MKKIILLWVGLLLTVSMSGQSKIKVACVGNSVTFGYGIDNREQNSYPAQLQALLGNNYEVKNFGKSGATLLKRGHRPYNEQEEYAAAIAYAGDYVVIHLGLNDTDPRNWPNFRDEFIADYLSLINDFRQTNPACKIWICRMTPISHRHSRFKSGTRDWFWMEQEVIENIAELGQTGLIDLHTPLYNRPDLLPDAIHPTAEGAGIIAKTVYSGITGNYGGLQMPITYSNNMVLQREKPLEITGIANAGEQISVEIAGKRAEAITNHSGKWSVTLPAMNAGGPYLLSITSSTRSLRYENVYIGEVWICSGQSNMAFRVNEMVKEEHNEMSDYAEKSPQIHLFNMQSRWLTNAVEWDAAVMDSLNRLQYYHDTRWQVCDKNTADQFSAIGFAFGKMLADSLQIPIGLILNAVGGSGTEAWIDRKTLEFDFTDVLYDWTNNDFIQDWARGRAKLNIKQSKSNLQRHPYEPCYLFETGIAPLQQYAIRGFLWYQGESNAHNIESHERLMQLLVKSWRNEWGNNELPFYYVQLSSINRPSWPWFRDSQRRLMNVIPESGMAVSSDRGDSLDVHPRRKKDVGERLARWALHKTYGYDIVPSGPLFNGVEFTGNVAYVSFQYGEGMHTADGEAIRTFEIAEHDGLFVPAEAVVEGNRVKVWSDEIQKPAFVRYGWQPFTRANLVNGEELPASTFRNFPDEKQDTTTLSMMKWEKMPDLSGQKGIDKLGVSAPFVGIHKNRLIVAGGCNFPDVPAADGGSKKYYSSIFTLDLSDTNAQWTYAGEFPYPIAYGASVSTLEGVVCIGGNNQDGKFANIHLLSIPDSDGKVKITPLPTLPMGIDNLAACYANGTIYVAGGDNGKQKNAFLSMNKETNRYKKWVKLPDFPGATRLQPVLTAQESGEGIRIYLAGGYQPARENQPAKLPTELLAYNPQTKKWTVEAVLPNFPDLTKRTLTGGYSVPYGENGILYMGGVNHDIFLRAITRPDIRPQEEKDMYMRHPVSWYKFNRTLLLYNTITKEWKSLGDYEQLARAGAGAVLTNDNRLIIVNGELKPGIRTPQVNSLQLP